MIRAGWLLCVFLLVSSVSCAGPGTPATITPTPAPAQPAVPTPSAVTAMPTPTSTPGPVVQDVRVTRLRIPALGIDAEVQRSQAIPDTRVAAPGCPARPAGGSTWSVPESGITTPELAFEGLENKAWIFGHSRWRGEPGLLFVLEDISVGDELFVDGVDRQTGQALEGQRYVVEGIYLTDTESGGALVTADGPEEVPAVPTVVLQTSVRERGQGKAWLLDQEKVLAKATTLVAGSIDDPCKYLLLFVIARAA